MKYILPSLLLAVLLSPAAIADDNIANCEIVVQRPIAMTNAEALEEKANAEEDSRKTDSQGAQIATFLPAADFIFSVFDAKTGHLTEIDGQPIRAVMCVRSSVIPTEFDLKIIRTGLPFYLSPDFDAKDSALMAIHSADGSFVYDYVGPDLSKDDIELLKLRMALFNQKEDEHED